MAEAGLGDAPFPSDSTTGESPSLGKLMTAGVPLAVVPTLACEPLAGALPAVSEAELPLSCTPSARTTNPVVPTSCDPEGAVGAVMPDCFVFKTDSACDGIAGGDNSRSL